MTKKKRDHHKEILLKSPGDIAVMRDANRIVAEILQQVASAVAPGISTAALDRLAEEQTKIKGARPAFKGYHGFPGTLCVSINEQVVHGIPSHDVLLADGDIVSIDFGVHYKGFYGDAAITVPVGLVEKPRQHLIEVTREALEKGIAQAVPGNRIVDISRAIQTHVEQHGYSVVRQFVGHGIGTSLHEGPEVPNFVRGTSAMRLLAGMVLAIEPMVNMGTYDVIICDDGWTVVTADKMPSAHFEHSVAITENGPFILSEAS